MPTPEQIVAALQRTVPLAKETAMKVMHEAVELTQSREAENAPGSIGERINATVRETQGGVSGILRPKDKFAGFVDAGTGLFVEHHHKITPTTSKNLKFIGPNGQLIFRRAVKGQKPQDFVDRTRHEVAGEVETILASGRDRIIKELPL